MQDPLDLVYQSIDEEHADKSASTRRQIVGGAAAALGGMGLLGFTDVAEAKRKHKHKHTKFENPQTILNVAATAEVLATIVNTIGSQQNFFGGDAVTLRNIKAAAREELVHYDVLRSIGGKPLTKKIWVPDAVFSSKTNLLSTLEVGDQIFVNAYLLGTTTFAGLGNSKYARITAEFMGVEAVHRALARQSLGKLGNDRVFMRYSQREMAPDAPNKGQVGFTKILRAVAQLEAAGFGFGKEGSGTPGQFYEFDTVKQSTPTDPDLNTYQPN